MAGEAPDDLMENNEKKDSSIPFRKGPIERILSERIEEKLLIQKCMDINGQRYQTIRSFLHCFYADKYMVQSYWNCATISLKDS